MSENLVIRPVAPARFDVVDLVRWLDARPDSVEIWESPPLYCLAGTSTGGDYIHCRRMRDPDRIPRTVLIHLGEDQIRIENDGDAEESRSAMDFVSYVLAHHEVQIRTEGYDRDLTPAVRERGASAAFSEGVAETRVGWSGLYREIGFFEDLPHGRSTSVTVEEARRELPIADEAELVSYLRAGRFFEATDVVATDVLDDSDEPVVIGPVEVLTDGVYLWPSDLPYYVAKYHVRLPRHFVLHARANGWKVPPADPSVPRLWRMDNWKIAFINPRTGMPSPQYLGPYSTLWFDGPNVVLGRRIRVGTGDEVREGYLADNPTHRVLVTLTMDHYPSQLRPLHELSMPVDGIAAFRWIGPVPEDSIPYEEALVEDMPPGRPALDAMPFPEPAARTLGARVARAVVDAHARGLVIAGICPELVYVDAERSFTGLVPRGRAFIASAPQRASGLRSYAVPYDGFEALALGKPADKPGDIFALCATLQHLATGRHPFGEEWPEILQRVVANAREPYAGSKELEALLARGMDPDPGRRPTAQELAKLLAELSVTA